MAGKTAIFAMMMGGMIMVEGGCASRNLRSQWSGTSGREVVIAPRLQTLTVTFTLSPSFNVHEAAEAKK